MPPQLAKAEAAAERKKHDKTVQTPMPPAHAKTPDGKDDHPDSTGSGVVIDEKGDILTNLHVIYSTDRWVVTFCRRQQVGRRHGQSSSRKTIWR